MSMLQELAVFRHLTMSISRSVSHKWIHSELPTKFANVRWGGSAKDISLPISRDLNHFDAPAEEAFDYRLMTKSAFIRLDLSSVCLGVGMGGYLGTQHSFGVQLEWKYVCKDMRSNSRGPTFYAGVDFLSTKSFKGSTNPQKIHDYCWPCLLLEFLYIHHGFLWLCWFKEKYALVGRRCFLYCTHSTLQ